MDHQLEGTKLALVMAAGELFADFGLQGASIRHIVEKAGTNIAAVNYHFGSKENLFRETLIYAIQDSSHVYATRFLERARKLESREEYAELIRELVHSRFKAYFNPNKPFWQGKLIQRCILESPPELRELVIDYMKPDHLAMSALMQLIRPDLSQQEAELFGMSLTGQIIIYMLARIPILLVQNRDDYDPQFLDQAAEHVAYVMNCSLGLVESGLPPPDATYGDPNQASSQYGHCRPIRR